MAASHRSPQGSSSSLSSPPPSSSSTASSDSELSELSATPSPPSSPSFAHRPLAYFSPSSSQKSSAKTSPAPDKMRPTPPASDNDGPVRKKRKLNEPKQRTTERLDLTRDNVENDPQLRRLLDVLQKKKKIVVIAGAGISVSAGIPDFRSSGGLFSSLRKQHKLKSSGKDLFDASVYRDDSSTSSFHDMVRSLSQKTKCAQPTPFHHLLATLAQEGRLLRLYSQNVDGIDTSLPPLRTQVPLPKKGPWPKTVQLHGGLDHMVCSKCHTLSDFDAEQFNGPVPPACPHCKENDQVRQVAEKRSHGIGRLRPRMVLYNEHNPDDEAIGSCASLDLRTRPDAVIVAGTTLKVPGVRRIAREMCAVARDRRDGVTVWINNDPEPVGKDLANSWDLIVKGPCDEVARLAAMPRWDDPITFKEITDDEVSQTKEKQKAVVMVPVSTPKKQTLLDRVQMPTPAASPRLEPKKESGQDQITTTKAQGRKRKSDVQPKGQEKPKPATKRQAPRKAAAKKTTVKENQKMTNIFSVSKGSTVSRIHNKKDIPHDRSDVLKENPNHAFHQNMIQKDTIVMASKMEETKYTLPSVAGVRQCGLTRWKQTAMIDISQYDMGPDGAPRSPVMEPFTSAPSSPQRSTPSTPYFTPKQDFETPEDARPSTADSRKSDTIFPHSVPKTLNHLFDVAL
ncbi:DHS-like NAD/FAD-binding domain-containing protein [Westerdykella ornata]|uniref:DHS-like NAD/FAD-binding domain-containing protein n=1 Tax=Westerdykella ornata TaxID=318751 RepID=A0A6A6J8K5_WESOR|nr:DHS-like NAD/FAD-binding domain-containing protein [Westerdykella ornata]KAF2271539.1 DHS-like NAD/FAD-binding domain-containing protein [Westerdykella ornata]